MRNLEKQSCRHFFVEKFLDKRLEDTLLRSLYLEFPNLKFSKGVSKGIITKNSGPTVMDFFKHLWGSHKKNGTGKPGKV